MQCQKQLCIFLARCGCSFLVFQSSTSYVMMLLLDHICNFNCTCFVMWLRFVTSWLVYSSLSLWRNLELHPFTQASFGAVSLLAAAFAYYFIVETKGRSLEEIEMSLNSTSAANDKWLICRLVYRDWYTIYGKVNKIALVFFFLVLFKGRLS